MVYLNPKNIVVDFLRKRVSDPRTRITSTSDTFTATAAQTEFSLTPSTGQSLSYVDYVTVDGDTMTKWQDYYIDFKGEKIVFFTGITLGLEVIVYYGESSSDWIFPDKPNTKLSATKFPRINVLSATSIGTRQGNYEAPVEAVIRFQVDVWTKEKQDNQIFTIDGQAYTGEDLAHYLAYQVTKAFEDHESDLFPALYGYDPVGMPRSMPFDDELQCHHTVVEFYARGVKLGRIS